MQVIYAKEDVPLIIKKSVFLAGPTPRSADVRSWRPEAIEFFTRAGFDGIIFSPEPRDGNWSGNYIDQVDWEDQCLNMADCVLFWVPREVNAMPAFTTNDEWGFWKNSGKVVFGAPESAAKVRYQKYYAEKLKVPNANTLEYVVKRAIEMVGEGATRVNGERFVPLHVWNTPQFKSWYEAQTSAGNRLDWARVEWTFRIGKERNLVFFWALHAHVYIGKEGRQKTNEVVFVRPDISAIVMYKRGQTPAQEDVDIVLVREFRSPSASSDGYVWEIPGGSSFKPNRSPQELAAEECFEETGLKIDSVRIKQHGSRQMMATLSAHKAHLFSVEITDQELEWLRSQKGVVHGVVDDTERTYVEVVKLRDIITENKVDWSTVGMILSVIC
jgi:8-oxo-dGTP pyrophosphatase MutT (NUDIX family)